MMIFIFKTSVTTKGAVLDLSSKLNVLLKASSWSFDLDDCDHILRIDSPFYITDKTIQLLHDNGFDCEELID